MRIEPLLDNLMDQQNDDLDWTGFQRRLFPSERPHEEAGRNVYRRVVELVEG
ncbi:hypothetical protein M1O55_04075 [Dehalococcoidia bacterium]|nr:hypothetical protein [Dehalococcoidia bacterium]